ncbi:MAG: hypothetical protein K5795_05625 [Lachnospiraceae bacterium]|nr:hypothetical protein [Lachnospiraceae bacterium]
MKYGIDESMRMITERKDKLICQNIRKKISVCLAGSIVISVLLLAVIFDYSGFEKLAAEQSVYGSLMLSEKAGGYIIVGIASFVVAVVITLFCIKLKEKDEKRKSENKNKYEEEA